MHITVSPLRFKSLYITRFLLEMIGISLVVCALFVAVLAYLEPKGRHGEGGVKNFSILGTLMLIDGIGFLLPQIEAKVVASFLLSAASVWLFYVDAYRSSNYKIYCLFMLPILLTLWLFKGYKDLNIRKLPSKPLYRLAPKQDDKDGSLEGNSN